MSEEINPAAVEIITHEQKIWQEVKEKSERRIKDSRDLIMIDEEICKIAEKKIEEEKEKKLNIHID